MVKLRRWRATCATRCVWLMLLAPNLIGCRLQTDTTDYRQYRQFVVGCRPVSFVGQLPLTANVFDGDKPFGAIHAPLFN